LRTFRQERNACIKAIWAKLLLGDWLALYQHARRHTRWREETEDELRKALGEALIESVYHREVPHDALLFLRKKR